MYLCILKKYIVSRSVDHEASADDFRVSIHVQNLPGIVCKVGMQLVVYLDCESRVTLSKLDFGKMAFIGDKILCNLNTNNQYLCTASIGWFIEYEYIYIK